MNKTKVKNKLLTILAGSSILALTACTTNNAINPSNESKKQESQEYNEITAYFDQQDRSLNNIKEVVLGDYFNQTFNQKEFNKNLINFLNFYKKILNLPIEKANIDNYNDESFNKDEINASLKKFDEIVNTNILDFSRITSSLVNEITETYSKLLSKNKRIENFNSSLLDFKLTLVDFGINPKTFEKFIQKNFSEIVGKKEEVLNNILNINVLYEEISSIFTEFSSNKDVLQSEITKFSLLQEKLKETSNLEELKTELEALKKDILNNLKNNNLVSNDATKLKKSILDLIEENNKLTEDQKTELKNKLENSRSSVEVKNIRKEIEVIASNINSKINEIIDSSASQFLSEENKQYLKIYLQTFDNLNEIESFETSFALVSENFSQVLDKINSIKNKISNSQLKPQSIFEFYKLKAEYDKYIKDEKVYSIKFSNLDETKEKLTQLITSLSTLEENDNTITDTSKTIENLFLEEAQSKLKYNLNDNLSNFDLKTYLFSASINKENNKMYLVEGDTDLIDYEVKNIVLKEEDKNTLVLTIEASLKPNPSIRATLTKEVNGFTNDINTEINKISFSNLDELYNINYEYAQSFTNEEINSLTNNEEINKILDSKLNGVANFFGYKLKDNRIQVEANKLKSTVLITFGEQTIKEIELSSQNDLTFRDASKTKEQYKDEKNLEKVNKIINGTADLFLSEIKFKESSAKNHSYYLASQAKEAFENEYYMPKFGKYEIFIKNVATANNQIGRAQVELWYKENGVEAPLPTENHLRNKRKNIYYFRRQSIDDIQPINHKFFTADDFATTTNSSVPQADIDMFNNITEANFNFRKAFGKTYNDKTSIGYRSLNINDFIEQEAFRKFEYFITLDRATNRSGADLDQEEFVPFNAPLYSKEITITNDNDRINRIKNNYYIYAFDFEKVGRRGLNFKLGFINKANNSVRYKLDKTFSLINIVNDYEQILYPEIILNNIKRSDLQINNELLSSKSAYDFSNDLEALNQAITINAQDGFLKHNNFKIKKDKFKIVEIKRINNNTAFVRFGTEKYDHSLKNNEVVHEKVDIKSKTWFKISGFKNSLPEQNNPIQNLDFENSNLETIVTETGILRKRIIEQYWKDLNWTLNEEKNIASWTFDKKYIEKTFLNNSRKRKLNLHIYGYRFVNDFRKNDRIKSEIDGLNFQLDFEELLAKQTVIKEYTIPSTTIKSNQVPEIKVKIVFIWNPEKGIDVSLIIPGRDNKIVISQPESVKFSNDTEVFNKDHAFVMLPGGSKVSIEYENYVEDEDFGLVTNKFDYNDVDYNQLNQPILFSNKIEDLMNRTTYNPNQNVSFKLNNGYKTNLDHIRLKDHRKDPYIASVWARTMRYTQGTATMIGKVSKDPKDGRFYMLTNHHVQGMDDKVNNWEDYSGENFLKEYTNTADRRLKLYFNVPYEYVGNNINPGPNTDGRGWGYSYVSDNVRNPGFSVSTTLVWTGRKQLDKYTGTKTIDADLTVIVWDINPIIKALKARGMMHVAKHIENWFNLPELKFNWQGSKYSFIPGPHTKDIVHIGYPLGDQSGYINHRAKTTENSVAVSIQNDYSFVRITGGNSGSGFFIGENEYASTLYGGHLGRELYGRNYDTEEFNYFGINWNNEDPLTLKNKRSFGSMILRANAKDPNAYALPWFFKEVK
ncbi:hypothetical protein MCANUFG1_00423 [Mycoplasmopsis canis UFG1]|uniref:MGA_1079 family surface serine endopeptidase n=1 Tax=Mycoplasmopsis canis TaxID=29555 RepID=UPI00025B094E|nr:hypothetical protein [Mycoplasmopsis canis]EIE42059.1 hypothetical protein MCANUFG1_00423 [Mycoplasmopsis canis UFG1]